MPATLAAATSYPMLAAMLASGRTVAGRTVETAATPVAERSVERGARELRLAAGEVGQVRRVAKCGASAAQPDIVLLVAEAVVGGVPAVDLDARTLSSKYEVDKTVAIQIARHHLARLITRATKL